jgi:hypothetical protein
MGRVWPHLEVIGAGWEGVYTRRRRYDALTPQRSSGVTLFRSMPGQILWRKGGGVALCVSHKY